LLYATTDNKAGADFVGKALLYGMCLNLIDELDAPWFSGKNWLYAQVKWVTYSWGFFSA